MVRAEAAGLLTYALEHPTVPPARVADMLFRTRVPRRHRTILAVSDHESLLSALRAVADDRNHPSVVHGALSSDAQRVGFVFPGQGGQRPGMGRVFYDAVEAYRTEADRCAALFETRFGQSPLSYLLDDSVPADAGASTVQPALFTQMAALAAMWRSYGVTPDVTIGHSQGEIAAAYVSGTVPLSDAVAVVGIRAGIVDTFGSSDYAMAVAAIDRDACEDIIARRSGWAEVSVLNSASMAGISGDRETIHEIVEYLTAKGIFSRVIPVRYPAHTSLMNTIGDKVRQELRDNLGDSRFQDSPIDCFGATLGEAITPDLPQDQYWFLNLRNPVRFDRAITAALAQGVDTFVELAEHPTLQLAVQENCAAAAGDRVTSVVGTSTRAATNLDEFTMNLAAIAVNTPGYGWENLRAEPPGKFALPLRDFPNAPTNDIRLWLPYNETGNNRAEQVASSTQSIPVRAEPRREPGAQVVLEEWVRLTQRSLRPARPFSVVDPTGDCAQLVSALQVEAEDQGVPLHLVVAGEVAEDTQSLVIVVPGMPETDEIDSVTAVSQFFAGGNWLPPLPKLVSDCWIVTAGGESVTSSDLPPNPVHAAISAGYRTLAMDHPSVTFRHLDLGHGDAQGGTARAVFMALMTGGESELALRDGVLHVKRLRLADPSEFDAAGNPAHVLITGGTGALGLELCEHYSQAGAQHITLLSRSGETPSIAERLALIRRASTCVVTVATCDVGDAAAMARLADELAHPVDLIAHAAADFSSTVELDLRAIKAETVVEAFRGKVLGLPNLLSSFARESSCRVVLFSSLAATLGGRGMLLYAAANRMIDSLATRYRAAGVDCVSVQWGQWDVFEGRDSSDLERLGGLGYRPMNSAEAIRLGMNGLRQNAIVADFDWARGYATLNAFGHGSALSELAQNITEATPEAPTHHASSGGRPPRDLISLLAEVIGADQADTIDTTAAMVALGVDSLQALEFRRRVKAEFDYELEVSDLLGGASINDIIATLEQKASPPAGQRASARPAEPITLDDITQRARATAEKAMPSVLNLDVMHSARDDLDLFGMHAMMAVLRPALQDGAAHSAADIADRLSFTPRHRWLLNRWLEVLTSHGHLSHHPDHGYRLDRPLPAPTRARLLDVCQDLGYRSELVEFMEKCNNRLLELGQDRARVQELLFPDGDMLTAEAGYRENLISRYLNLAARETVSNMVARLQRDHSPVRILELGAGIGGTTDEVIAGLSGLPVDYHFTDVSTFFLAAAQERFANNPQLRYGLMNLNTDLSGADRYDIVLGANVIHNATHIGHSLRQLHDVINPGGAIVFIETCNANYQVLTSLKFLMSAAPGQTHPGQSDIRAGERIFLTEGEWNDELSQAGFRPLMVLPEAGHPLHLLDQRVFAAVRD
ncbi:nocobactin polyketide synthase NbtC [Mycobacteroides salmoniphilum]|uniref:nocobactin polyketide synthase NbtC n=1 Tax=Mycobacteroides salmoniphilum TaxID=404941 RepID=UPI0030B8D631